MWFLCVMLGFFVFYPFTRVYLIVGYVTCAICRSCFYRQCIEALGPSVEYQ